MLIDGINQSGRYIDFPLLNKIVEQDNKKRYSFNEGKTKIRANQGHSISVDLKMQERIPPDILFHGTAIKYLDSIYEYGILKKSRNYVHLSQDADTAMVVGQRHGEAVVLTIDAKRMVSDGFKFYLSENGIWQTEFVPKKYIQSKAGKTP